MGDYHLLWLLGTVGAPESQRGSLAWFRTSAGGDGLGAVGAGAESPGKRECRSTA